MNNRTALKVFTESMYELLSENLTLYQALKILCESKLSSKKIVKTAEYLANEIEKGALFSNALRSCPFIDFNNTYISFASFSEKTGNLTKVMGFLSEKSRREEEALAALKNALVYPVFVFCLVIVLFVMFVFSDGNFWGEEGLLGITKIEAAGKVGVSFLFVLFLSVIMILFFRKNIVENKVYEAFLSGGFLVKEGVNMSVAVGMAAVVSGIDTKIGEVFQKAKEKLEYGMDIRTAFSCDKNKKSINFSNRKLSEVIERSLCFAEKTGNKDDVLLKIASYVKKCDDRNRKTTLLLVEPVSVTLLGVFLLTIVFQIILPVFSNFGIN